MNVNRRDAMMTFSAACLAGITIEPVAAPAQTFQNYRCDDGTKFVAAFYPYDARAYLQIDGAAVTLGKRLALSGSRYSGGGVTLKISKAGVAIKHGNRPATACAPL
jgi:membrane-bound inhibitor of C-type lysozyme